MAINKPTLKKIIHLVERNLEEEGTLSDLLDELELLLHDGEAQEEEAEEEHDYADTYDYE